MKQRADDRYDYLCSLFLPRVGTAKENSHTRLIRAVADLIFVLWTKKRRVQAHPTWSAMICSSRKAVELAAGRKVV